MNTILIAAALFFIPLQKTKVHYSKGVLHYGNEVMQVETVGSILQKSYRFVGNNGQELIYFKRRREATREINQQTGEEVMVTFFDVIIKGATCNAEIGEKELGLALMSEKNTIVKLAEFTLPGLVEDGKINQETADFLCKKLGNHYSDLLFKY